MEEIYVVWKKWPGSVEVAIVYTGHRSVQAEMRELEYTQKITYNS